MILNDNFIFMTLLFEQFPAFDRTVFNKYKDNKKSKKESQTKGDLCQRKQACDIRFTTFIHIPHYCVGHFVRNIREIIIS